MELDGRNSAKYRQSNLRTKEDVEQVCDKSKIPYFPHSGITNKLVSVSNITKNYVCLAGFSHKKDSDGVTEYR